MAESDDLQPHHHSFSVRAHNRSTDILYSAEPSPAEIESLIELAHVAHWHWEHRADKTTQNIAVALWLLSRAYSANGLGTQALNYAQQSLATLDGSGLLPSFFGYAHEALARAYLLLDDVEQASLHFKLASEIAETVPSPQAKRYLLDQIDRIQMPI
jgi:phage gp46-like protein